jgi:hypothetical protein
LQINGKHHFQNKAVIDELNTNFILYPLMQRPRKPLHTTTTLFYFKPNGTNTGIHELATALATIDDQVVPDFNNFRD